MHQIRHAAGVVAMALAVVGCGAVASARDNCNQSAREIFPRVAPAVVSIAAVRINTAHVTERYQRSEGSGFVIGSNDKGLLIVTNAHVVFGAQALLVTFQEGMQSSAAVIGLDPIFDVALIGVRAEQAPRVTSVVFGDSDTLAPGQTVIALGNPFGLFHTLTVGVVSAINRVLPAIPFTLSEPYIQIDTPINPGNSGGPLLDLCGRVVGINTAVITGANNIGFAIPANLAKNILPILARDGHLARPWIGFHGQFIGDSLAQLLKLPLAPGFLVEHVESDSPAEKAGLRGGHLALTVNGEEFLLGGDIILAVNGVATADVGRALRAVFDIKLNDTVGLLVLRDGKRETLSYRAAERPLQPSDMSGLLNSQNSEATAPEGIGVSP